ncbi:MAG TPA: fused MFS/spermidine synthase, partial [Nevskiaceae bacterium]|nr:fused MFS/spermidine synthase [Nevskiaceae bacterium]
APRFLTSYYLMISLGGALAGVFAGVLAPRLFTGHHELPLALAFCAALMLHATHNDAASRVARAAWFAGLLAALALCVQLAAQIAQQQRHARVLARNFYGVLSVRDEPRGPQHDLRRVLMHGSIIHGEEFLDDARARQPITYYTSASGIGRALATLQPRGALRIGVVGLGAGTLAAYGRAGDVCRFYELNPQVIDIAQREFRFLSLSPAQIELVPGDARLSLQSEAPQQYDLLAVDAFSGDAIPVHLLTLQAFQLYLSHLKTAGVLALHLTNRHLDLLPVAAAAAQRLHLAGVRIDTAPAADDSMTASTWVLLSRDAAVIAAAPIAAAAQPLPPPARAWTDDYSSAAGALKWRSGR